MNRYYIYYLLLIFIIVSSIKSMIYSPLQFTMHKPQSLHAWRSDQVIDAFCTTILPKISENPYPIETFLYLLSTKNKAVVSGWKSLIKKSQQSNQECFEIICKHFSPLQNIVHFSHFPRGTQTKTQYPYILNKYSDEYKKLQSHCIQLIGPPVTAYTLASTLKNYPVFMTALYNTGNAILPYEKQNVILSNGLFDQESIPIQSVLPGHPTNIRLFNDRKSLALLEKHYGNHKTKSKILTLLLLTSQKSNAERSLLPELINIVADYYIPSIKFMPLEDPFL